MGEHQRQAHKELIPQEIGPHSLESSERAKRRKIPLAVICGYQNTNAGRDSKAKSQKTNHWNFSPRRQFTFKKKKKEGKKCVFKQNVQPTGNSGAMHPLCAHYQETGKLRVVLKLGSGRSPPLPLRHSVLIPACIVHFFSCFLYNTGNYLKGRRRFSTISRSLNPYLELQDLK